MKKIIFLLIVVALSSNVFAASDKYTDTDQLLGFGIGYSEHSISIDDYFFDSKDIYLSLNCEKSIKYINNITTFSSFHLVLPFYYYIVNFEDFDNVSHKEIKLFDNLPAFESSFGIKFSKSIYDEFTLTLSAGVNLNLTKVKITDTLWETINLGYVIGIGLISQIDSNTFICLDCYHVRYNYNLSLVNNNLTFYRNKDFEFGGNLLNISIFVLYKL
ncbi:MAG: hypothetical protein ACPKM0_11900 [Pleomorphochaeta sp.]